MTEAVVSPNGNYVSLGGTTDSNGNDAGSVLIKDPSTLWDVSDSTRADADSRLLDADGDGKNLIIQRSKRNGALVFKITGTGTETLTLTSILEDNSATGIESNGILCKDLTTNANHTAVAITDDGTYITPENIPGYFWKFTKSGIVDTPTITYMDA